MSKINCFYRPKSVFRRYCVQNGKDGIQIQVYNINNESVNHFNQFISVKVMKNFRKSKAQFREKLRKLKLREINGFLIKKRVFPLGAHSLQVIFCACCCCCCLFRIGKIEYLQVILQPQ